MNIILIPYRNREEHWKVFKEYLVPVLRKYIKNLKIVLVEQAEGKSFNKGKLLNAGFKEYEKEMVYLYHNDVDTIPNEKIVKELYTKEENDIMRLSVAHNTSLGGVIKMRKEIFKEMNGFPNNIWGWGIEDRALYYKAIILKLSLSSIYNEHGCGNSKRFILLNHETNAVSNYINEKKKESEKWGKHNIDKLSDEEMKDLIWEDGLKDVKYKIIKREIIDKDKEKIIIEI